ENTKFKTRFEKLKRKNKTDTINLTVENIKLKTRVIKLEQKQLQNDKGSNLIFKLDGDIKEIKQVDMLTLKKQSSTSISKVSIANVSCRINSDDTLKQIVLQHNDILISDISNNTSNSSIYQKLETHKSLEDKGSINF
ncbi:7174_t:CDS:1, partial [Diversispora eburnea]